MMYPNPLLVKKFHLLLFILLILLKKFHAASLRRVW